MPCHDGYEMRLMCLPKRLDGAYLNANFIGGILVVGKRTLGIAGNRRHHRLVGVTVFGYHCVFDWTCGHVLPLAPLSAVGGNALLCSDPYFRIIGGILMFDETLSLRFYSAPP